MIIFTYLADFLSYTLLGLAADSRLGESVHFFIEDTTKIFALLLIMIYLIAIARAAVDTDRIRNYLQGKHRGIAYVMASIFGAITPFCSCSSIPLFLGFTSARIPLGITMAFLITSPMINEVAVILLGSILGIKFMIVYVITGILAGVLGGFFIDAIGAEKYLSPLGQQAMNLNQDGTAVEKKKLTMKDRHDFAKEELKEIFARIWKWVFIGVGLGALLHGFVPADFISNNLGQGSWWSVPAAVVLGIPLYANASGVIPVAQTLMAKGLPVGTTLAFMMSVVAASFPEFMMLKQVMKPKLLMIFFLMLLVFFTLSGWIFNLIY
ncbi:MULTISPECIES: permease [unclassified Oceanispirochaeta]|uniref:permease n=1 Tax=unclassified Oceanispirochaeta TaxID=2635722 RepID=UPI0018F2AFB8|nr:MULTISPECIES: permease [unclassified Oceanispirochaeta]